ncbi:hypothetical protein HW555_009001 [Spodoptera exigua]|uniref:Uncharacterized protein n=1 Tax=Spodoptera exigua TaxID=7107 RepID=A0A835GDC9_SPOEX|nr:hypothetical protein HW555_009001 [Spodoptera exigua]
MKQRKDIRIECYSPPGLHFINDTPFDLLPRDPQANASVRMCGNINWAWPIPSGINIKTCPSTYCMCPLEPHTNKAKHTEPDTGTTFPVGFMDRQYRYGCTIPESNMEVFSREDLGGVIVGYWKKVEELLYLTEWQREMYPHFIYVWIDDGGSLR